MVDDPMARAFGVGGAIVKSIYGEFKWGLVEEHGCLKHFVAERISTPDVSILAVYFVCCWGLEATIWLCLVAHELGRGFGCILWVWACCGSNPFC